MLSSPLSLASSVPSSPSFRDDECGWGDLPELLRFGDQPPSPPWDFDAEKCLSELASPQPPSVTPPPSPPSSSRAPTTSPTPSPPPRLHVTSPPYQVALEAVEEALMCTAVPPPSPPQAPKYVPKDPHPLKNHCSRALQCQNTAAHPGESWGWGSIFCRRCAEPPSDVLVCGSAAQEKPPAGVAAGHAN